MRTVFHLFLGLHIHSTLSYANSHVGTQLDHAHSVLNLAPRLHFQSLSFQSRGNVIRLGIHDNQSQDSRGSQRALK